MPLTFTVGPNVIASYRRLAYSPWHAIAEFVDNATQSYFNNREALDVAAIGQEVPLTVNINYDLGQDVFQVSDNGMGMSFDELTHALHLAQPPLNTSGRSKYGLGMKTAACWIGNHWVITTKKLGEPKEYTVTVDVDKIVSGDTNLLFSTKDNMSLDEHYTKIRITRHNQKFKSRTLGKIRQYLSSMYRQDFRTGILALYWQNDRLFWDELDGRLLRALDGSVYQKKFDFFTKDDVDPLLPQSSSDQDPQERRVSGWVGILERGSRRDAGFSILHSGRVVKGWPDSWRPESLFGENSNDLVNQRLVGEIHLDDFEVSHTKDNIQWLGDQEEQVEKGLRQVCEGYREIALTFRKNQPDQRGPSEMETRIAIQSFEKEIFSPEMHDAVHSDPLLPLKLVQSVVGAVIEDVTSSGREPTFSASINGLTVRGFVDKMSFNDPYVAVESTKADEVIIAINSAHPHWLQLEGSQGVLNYLRDCTYDGIAEWQARNKLGRLDPDTIKILKDKLLRLSMEIERHGQP